MTAQRQVAFLKGINVGGHRRMSMTELREVLKGLGYQGVETYLQSGNVVLESDAPPDRVAREIEEAIRKRFGVDVPVIVRTGEELAAIVARNPLAKVAHDPKRYLVTFLSAEPPPDRVRQVTAIDVSPEQVVFDGREVRSWHPNGIHRSPLAQLLTEQRLGVCASARNWATVTSLLDLVKRRDPRS
jgi:uncharacterized protein (DUF1697 family)